MFKFLLKKTLGKKNNASQEDKVGLKDILAQKSEKLSGFLSEKYDLIITETETIKEKLKNLQKTNYDLGLKHLKNGRLPEANFRFYFMTKVWPYDSYARYQLGYCLALRGKNKKAIKVLEELLEMNPDFDPIAQNLLNKLKELVN